MTASPRQRWYAETVIGTLVYAVVLGFFDDYTDLVDVTSFSTVFLAAFVLQVLTWLTFQVKGVAKALVVGDRARHQVGRVFAMWVVLFGSKFVFVEVIDLVFGDAIDFSSIWAVLAVVAVTTVLGWLGQWIYARLGGAE